MNLIFSPLLECFRASGLDFLIQYRANNCNASCSKRRSTSFTRCTLRWLVWTP